MELIFDLVKSGSVKPRNRTIRFSQNGGMIGRSRNSDFILEDEHQYISSEHVHIIFIDDTFFIKDESTNGTYLKEPYKRLPKSHPIKINSADIFIIGDHEIQARFSHGEFDYEDEDIEEYEDKSKDKLADYDFSSKDKYDDDIMDILDMNEDENSSVDEFINTKANKNEEYDDVLDIINADIEDEEFEESSNYIDEDLDMFDEHIEIARTRKPQRRQKRQAPPRRKKIEEEFYEEEILHEDFLEEEEVYEKPKAKRTNKYEEVLEEEEFFEKPKTKKAPRYEEDILDIDDFLEEDEKPTSLNKRKIKTKKKEPKKQVLKSNYIESIKILEDKLGIDILELNDKQRNRLMSEIGDILVNTIEGLNNSLNIKEQIQNELKISMGQGINLNTNVHNNPILLGKDSLRLLQNSSNINSLSKAVQDSLHDLNTHNIALHGSTKNSLKIILSKFSPQHLEYKFERNGSAKGGFSKGKSMWKAYNKMFDDLNNNPESGIKLIMDDYAKEYGFLYSSLKLNDKPIQQSF